jgi:hypothetical protein
MTQAEVEARQALDLAQPYFHHGHGPQALGQLQTLAHSQSQHQGQAQSSGFGFAGTTNSNASGGGAGLKGLGGNVFNIPLSLTRQLSQFSTAAAATRSQQQQQQQLGHHRVHSQQVVNPKDLFLNAEDMGSLSDTSSKDATLRLDNKRKRASWDGGVM